MNVEVECIQCCHIFMAVKGSTCEVWKLCAKCYLDKQNWYTCQDCGMKVSTTPCFICEKGFK